MKFEKDFSVAYSQERSQVWKSVETFLITLLLLLLARFIRPDDPLSLSGPIPWLIFAPIFCSLFFGAVYGIGSLIILLISIIFIQPLAAIDSYTLRIYIIGAIGFTLLGGFFSSYWSSRISHVEHLNDYVRQHLEDLSRNYYLLRISHERIEQAYIIKPVSFREAFYQIKQEMQKNNCEINTDNCQMLLGVISQFCSINNAAFCTYNEDSKEIIPLAFFGKQFLISADDPLIEKVTKNKTASYFDISRLIDKNELNESAFLTVIPLFNTQRKIMAFIVIKDMPFWALTHDNLETLSVFAAYFAMQWSTLNKVEHLSKEFPSCSSEFLNEFQTLVSLKKHNKIESALACLIVPPGSHQKNIVYLLERQKRSLDYIWVLSLESAELVITLMPLTNMEGILGYKKRITTMLKNDFGLELNTHGLNFRFQQINQQSENKQLHDFVEEATHAME